MSADASIDLLVIGAGAVGLAITRQAAMQGLSVILVEDNPSFGMETSSRNSEVIHAGIYYPQDSLKARLCVEGAHAMYAYCAERGVTANRIGKLIVATNDDQVEGLSAIMAKGQANGVPDLAMIGQARLAEMEPHLNAVAAIHSPFTGVVDSHNYMAALEADAENAGAIIAYLSRFEGAERYQAGYGAKRWHCRITSQGEVMVIDAGRIINAAGHGSHTVSKAIEGLEPSSIPPHYMAKGQYFTTTRKPPFSRLIYPMPSGGGLGIHLTLDAANGARFGPDIQWVEGEDYSVDPGDAAKFHRSISTYWPDLREDELVPAWAGLRPKIYNDGSRFQDFTIMTGADHGADGVTALYAIDSPGLTSSLALAGHVMEVSGIAA